jgi:F420-0:gamma-glutamyl ligase
VRKTALTSSSYNGGMKVTRRALAHMVAGTAVLSSGAIAQTPPAALGGQASDAEVNTARAGLRDAARELGAVKLSRATEPATRFEV